MLKKNKTKNPFIHKKNQVKEDANGTKYSIYLIKWIWTH